MKKLGMIGIIVAAIVLITGGALLYNRVLGPTKAASKPISAIPIGIETQAPTKSAEQALDPANTPAVMEATPTMTGQTSTTLTGAAAGNLVILTIVPDQSEASFNIHEELGGQPKQVIGTTNQVAGEVAIDPNNLSTVKFGPIQVDARTLATDNNQRNRAIRNIILDTNQYEFVTFTPTQIQGLSGSGKVGQTYTFQVAGNLTIRNITQPVTFDVTVQAESESQFTGTATAKITRSAFKLDIPSVPNVANVGDELTLQIKFVLAPASQ